MVCGNSYIAGSDEFDLLEEMVDMGFMEYTRTVLQYRCYRVTGRGAQSVGLRVPTREEIRSVLDPVPA
jgi:hypothetical protein